MSRILVTGASGFIGGAIAARLLDDGRAVRLLARDRAVLEGFAERGAETVAGDLLDRDSLAQAMAGCDLVYHVAGVNAMCVRDPRPMYEANVIGTRNAVGAAADAGVRRVVYTSSAATLGEAAGTIGSEFSPHRGAFLSHYERSKYQAERAAFRVAGETGIELVSVNPSSVQGPGRTRGTARLILDYVNGRLRTLVRSRFSLVDVDDCVEGHLLAEQRGEAGDRYVLSGVTVSTEEAMATVARITGIEHRTLNLPGPVALAAGGAVEVVGRVRGERPRLCREMVATLLHGHAYDGSRAERDLGLRYKSFDEMVRRTLDWYEQEGMIAAYRSTLPNDA